MSASITWRCTDDYDDDDPDQRRCCTAVRVRTAGGCGGDAYRLAAPAGYAVPPTGSTRRTAAPAPPLPTVPPACRIADGDCYCGIQPACLCNCEPLAGLPHYEVHDGGKAIDEWPGSTPDERIRRAVRMVMLAQQSTDDMPLTPFARRKVRIALGDAYDALTNAAGVLNEYGGADTCGGLPITPAHREVCRKPQPHQQQQAAPVAVQRTHEHEHRVGSEPIVTHRHPHRLPAALPLHYARPYCRRTRTRCHAVDTPCAGGLVSREDTDGRTGLLLPRTARLCRPPAHTSTSEV